ATSAISPHRDRTADIAGCRKPATLCDGRFGSQQKRFRNLEVERLGGLEIDHEFEFRRLLHRKLRRLGALQYLGDNDRTASKQIEFIGTVGHQGAGFGKRTCDRRRRQTMLESEFRGGLGRQAALHDDATRSLLFHARKCSVNLSGSAHQRLWGLDAGGLAHKAQLLKEWFREWIGSVAEN